MIPAIASSVIFLACLGLIFSEKINRMIVGVAGAVLMVTAGKILGFYSESQAMETVDFNTLGLLLGMMIMVAILEPTGFFQYLAVLAGKLSKGQPVRLLVLLGTITTVVSMFLDNVTTIVLIAPVTILICEIMGIASTPYLLAEAILSDTGGVATLIGDPPNIIIGSAAGLSFVDFLVYSLPIVLIVWLTALLMLRILFRKELSIRPKKMKAVMQLNPAEALNDAKTTRKVLIVLAGTIVMFFLAHFLHFSPAYAALTAAAAALVWVRPDVKKTLAHVEWSVLIFFAALFVMVGGLEASGALHSLVSLLAHAGEIPPVWLGVIIIWGVAGLSAVVDNIPITIAMIPIIHGLESQGIAIGPLWWALAFGAGFGGNGTIIGSTANIVVVTMSEKTRTPITAKLWNKRGLPVMLGTCAVATILYIAAFPLFQP